MPVDLKKPTFFLEITPPQAIAPEPFWMLTRWTLALTGAPESVADAEREEALAAHVTAFDDFGIGLAYRHQVDAEIVARAMAKRFAQPFGVYGGDPNQPELAGVFFGARGEEDCPGHVASEGDPKICGRCGVHIDSLRPPEDEP